jgi:glucuronate isomerase
MQIGIAMKQFMNENFLLETETAKILYHNHAKKMPIVDFHNHLNVRDIYENVNYENLSQVWLGEDHYKWRVLRANGVREDLITGKKSDPYEKYEAWAKTVPELIGNPLYHWTHLELKRFFDVDMVLSPETAEDIWNICNSKLRLPDYSVRNMIARMKVSELCTTDDPADNLRYHVLLQTEEKRFMVRPTYRPENAMGIQKETYPDYISRLSESSGINIDSYKRLKEALVLRMDYFGERGCRISDHSLEGRIYCESDEAELESLFHQKMSGGQLLPQEAAKFRGGLLVFLAEEYKKRDWVMQLHIGALRNNSTKAFMKLGVDIGFDSMDDFNYAAELSALLDKMDVNDALPKTILYNINQKDNEMLASMMGNFQDGTIPGKIQFGPAWWFSDNKRGMEKQMQTLSELGVFGLFVGMVTDSRSFLSISRHEYFRRILCNFIGNLVENGEYPNNMDYLGKIIENICFYNIKNYMKINEK